MVYHLVALPYPGRGHVNPMMNLCNSLIFLTNHQNQEILITFVVTEEWQDLVVTNHQKIPQNIKFSTIPNVLPSEQVRGKDFPGFYEAVMTKMKAPFEALLDKIEPQVDLIIADIDLFWPVSVANLRDIPIAMFWTCSASYFSILLHHELFLQNGHLGVELSERGEERVEYIPGISSIRIADLPTVFHGNDEKVLQPSLQCISRVKQAQYLIFNSIYELEPQATNILRSKYSFPLYTIGPAIPFFEINNNKTPSNNINEHDYLHWLDSQQKGSVLYISLGSFLSISPEQMEEIVAGVLESGVRFLFVSRGANESWFDQTSSMERGFVVPWCDQMRVLCHSSIGGFLSHCGWNSVLEAMYSGVPILTFPIFFDQAPNGKQIVEDWKIGLHVKGRAGAKIVMREEIKGIIDRLMDSESNEGKEMKKRVNEVKEVVRGAIAEGGSSVCDLNAFLEDVVQKSTSGSGKKD